MAAHAGQYDDFAVISSTLGVQGGRVCVGEASRGDIGCPAYAPSVATDGSISATRFVGDGSGLFNIAGASADRIVSGTTSMLAISNTGYISVTQSGYNTAYFHPSMGLVTVGVSSTGPISGSMGYFADGVSINSGNDLGNHITLTNYGQWASSTWVILKRSANDSWPNSFLISYWDGSAWHESVRITTNTLIATGADFTNTVRIRGTVALSSPTLHVTGAYMGGNITSMSLVNSNTYVNNAIGYVNTAPVVGLVTWQGTGNYGNTLSFLQAGGSGEGDFSAVGANAKLGSLEFWGTNGNSFHQAANIAAYSDGTPTATSTPGKLAFTTIGADGVGYERMRISSNGNVGIGTTIPSATLDVNGYMKLKKNTVAPVACSTSSDGSLALTSARRLCVCDGSDWKEVNSATACTW